MNPTMDIGISNPFNMTDPAIHTLTPNLPNTNDPAVTICAPNQHHTTDLAVENMDHDLTSMLETASAYTVFYGRQHQHATAELRIASYEDYTMSPRTFEFICQLLAPRLRRLYQGMPMVDARLQVMVALHKLTSSNTYRDASTTFNMKKSTGYICTNRVINALHTLAPSFIQWPSVVQSKVIAKEFEAVSGFPGVLGNVGCCRLPVLELLEKGAKEGVLFQVVCDHKMKIIHCGLTANSDVIQKSGLAQYLNPTKFPSNTHLIANNSYPLLENIMVPYLQPHGVMQKYFNNKLRSAFVIEDCLGSLLGRFESLSRGLSLNERANQRHINACCVLHNICILKNDLWDGVGPSVVMNETVPCPKGERKRDAIARQLAIGLDEDIRF